MVGCPCRNWLAHTGRTKLSGRGARQPTGEDLVGRAFSTTAGPEAPLSALQSPVWTLNPRRACICYLRTDLAKPCCPPGRELRLPPKLANVRSLKSATTSLASCITYADHDSSQFPALPNLGHGDGTWHLADCSPCSSRCSVARATREQVWRGYGRLSPVLCIIINLPTPEVV